MNSYVNSRLYYFNIELNGVFIAAIRNRLSEIQSEIERLWNRDSPEDFDATAIAWLILQKRAFNEELQDRLQQQLYMIDSIINS